MHIAVYVNVDVQPSSSCFHMQENNNVQYLFQIALENVTQRMKKSKFCHIILSCVILFV